MLHLLTTKIIIDLQRITLPANLKARRVVGLALHSTLYRQIDCIKPSTVQATNSSTKRVFDVVDQSFSYHGGNNLV